MNIVSEFRCLANPNLRWIAAKVILLRVPLAMAIILTLPVVALHLLAAGIQKAADKFQFSFVPYHFLHRKMQDNYAAARKRNGKDTEKST